MAKYLQQAERPAECGQQWRTQDFSMEGSVTSHRDDVKYYVILRHHDVTSLAVSI